MTHAMWRLKDNQNQTIYVNTSAEKIGFDVCDQNHELIVQKRGVWQEYWNEGIRVYYKQATLFLRGAGWETNVTRHPVYNDIQGPKWRFDVTIRPLTNTGFEKHHGSPSNTSWPHGLIGQTWDGDDIAVDGKQDNYEGRSTEIWTTAMGEGALEGDDPDVYIVTPRNFDFKYSRFAGAPSSPRDVAKILGVHRMTKALGLGASFE